MKKWKHINIEQRKIIANGVAHRKKLILLSEELQFDPTSISKEVKRNRYIVRFGSINEVCPKLNRWPYTCSACSKKYNSECCYSKYKYDAKIADNKARANLVCSRRGIDISSEEFQKMDILIKDGIDNKKSIYQIKMDNPNEMVKSLTTIYRYINNGLLKTKRIDLPYAVTYKKRKHNKKYEYTNNKIDRSSHTYLDYLSFIHQNPRANVWQLDFLGAIKSDSKAIITCLLTNIHFVLIDIINIPDSNKVVKWFNTIENKINTSKYIELFECILTDRDPCFSDIDGICFSHLTGEERSKIFYCDPYVSNQKPSVENMNKQLRKFFPKKSSIDKYTKKDIKQINLTILNTPLKSLDGFTPKDAFIKLYGEELFNELVVKDEFTRLS